MKRAKPKQEDPRREFPPDCTCLMWEYFKKRMPRPLCPVHMVRESSAQEVIEMKRVNRYTEMG